MRNKHRISFPDSQSEMAFIERKIQWTRAAIDGTTKEGPVRRALYEEYERLLQDRALAWQARRNELGWIPRRHSPYDDLCKPCVVYILALYGLLVFWLISELA